MGSEGGSEPCRHSAFAFPRFSGSPPGESVSSRPALKNKQRQAAGRSGRALVTTFPPAQVLPGDSLDPEYFDVEEEPQSFQDWVNEDARNVVTNARRTVYISPPPKISDDVKFLTSWKTLKSSKARKGEDSVAPSLDDIIDYIQAFYWPLPVKKLQQFEFVDWSAENVEAEPTRPSKKQRLSVKKRTEPQIALADHEANFATKIETRPTARQPFSHQLSTNDLIDALIGSLPSDAYASVLLLEHDIFEDEEDDYIIGRAFGGSRVSVVSMARYNPRLDATHNVPLEHTWPLNYCIDFIKSQGVVVRKEDVFRTENMTDVQQKPVLAAMEYALSKGKYGTRDYPSKTWLFRVCRTVSHELGHEFCLAHCSNYACIMQSSANGSEDARQPSYLCPVDFRKVQEATGVKEAEWCLRMAETCLRLGPEGGFGALAAWMTARAQEVHLEA